MRILLSVLAALGITTALILLMNSLIGDPEKIIEQPQEPKTVKVDYNFDKKPLPNRHPAEPQPPAVAPGPNKTEFEIPTSKVDSPVVTFDNVETVSPQNTDLPTGFEQGLVQETDRGAMAMYQAHPSYPIAAQLKGIEGWVVLSFDVDKSGAATNIKVVEAKPRHIFNKEAKRALKKWKFKPALEDGKEVAVKGQRARLEFNLPEEVAKN